MTHADPTLDAILAAIIAEPDDDLPRLAYADRLEELGDDARAEFIRASVRAAATGFIDCGSKDDAEVRCGVCDFCRPMMRAGEALRPFAPMDPTRFGYAYTHEHYSADQDMSKGHPSVYLWRGFVEVVAMDCEMWRIHGPRLVREHPIRVVKLNAAEVHFYHSQNKYFLAHSSDSDANPGDPRGFLNRLADAVPSLRGFYSTASAVRDAVSEACLAWARSRKPRKPRRRAKR